MQHYPTPSRPERIADGVVHGIGVAFALLGGLGLAVWAATTAPADRAVAVAVYGFGLVASFTASAIYHLSPWHHLRPRLRQADHAAIYLKIAGTITPLAVLLNTAMAWGLLALVWVVALSGAVQKLAFWHEPGRWNVLIYLALGWMSVLLIQPLAQRVPLYVIALIVAGGLLYTLGTVVFVRGGLRYGTAIWHGFVLAASACFFAAIALVSVA